MFFSILGAIWAPIGTIIRPRIVKSTSLSYVLKATSKKHLKNIPFEVESRRFQSRKLEQNGWIGVKNHTSRIFATRLP